ncbi:LamG domain-containing protein [Pseudomonas sp. CAU 1711]|uniref:LamG domain-containing protein n=1 Tax=Pseudomonas sp. CAU 1711 TaxID=3140356 RepID=UPI003261034C
MRLLRGRFRLGCFGVLVCLLLACGQAQAATYAFQSTSFAWETANTDVVWDQTQTAYPRDDDKQLINIGFTFNFAGVDYTQVRVHANGALQFGADTQFHRQYTNTDLPVTTAPPNCSGCTAGSPADRLLLVYWDDINPRLGGTVRYQTKGSAPNRRLVVSWDAVPHYNFGGAYSFQVILHESGDIVYQYGTGNASGVSATIGVEVSDSDFTLYSFNTSYSYAGTAIRWFRPTGEPNRLAEYRFEEGVLDGTVNEVFDWSGNGYFGQAIGPAAAEPDGYVCRGVNIPRNTDASIAAINSNIDVDATIGNSGSISFWYRSDVAWSAHDQQLLDATTQNNRWFFLVKRQGRTLRFVMSDSAGTHAIAETPAQMVSARTWKHITVTWRFAAGTNQTVLRIYVDGTQAVVTQTTTNGTLASSLGTLYIGDNRSGVVGQNGTLNSANGIFDSVRVYNHEISNAAVVQDMLATHSCVVFDHIRILHDGEGLTCSPESVTLQACFDSLCSSLYSGSVTTTLQANGVAVGSLTFSGGSGSLSFSQRTPASLTLSATGTSPPPSAGSSCRLGSSSSCQMNFVDSGFVLQVPTLLAAKPAAATLRAVKKADSSQACVPGFASVSRTVNFTAGYVDPASGSRSLQVNGAGVGAAPVPLTLAFDSSGTAPLTVRYDDAGLMTLAANYSGSAGTGDAGLVMSGSTQFLSKPYGLCLETDSTCTLAGVSGSCTKFRAAGDSFPLRIRAVGWESDGEPLTAAALCTGNITTPNFQLGNIALGHSLQAPSPGVAGSLAPTTYAHVLGDQTTATGILSEVGVFRLSATPPVNGYFGESVGGGESGLIGRLIPAYLSASGDASLAPACGAFSYQGQPIPFAAGRESSLTVTARNRTGGVTQNYDRGAFWRLAAPAAGAYASSTGVAALDAAGRLSASGTASLATQGADDGDGARVYRWSGQTLSYTVGVPGPSELPFTARVRQSFAAASLTDADGACQGSGSGCEDYAYDFAQAPGSEVRLGRLRIGNAHGSELQALELPLYLESWQNVAGGAFLTEGMDTCTVLGAPALDQYTGNLAAGETSPTLSGPLAGSGSLSLSAPGAGNDGSLQVSFPSSPAWLQYPWDGATRQLARGLASFGIYKGAAPLIFRRELYR